MRLPSAAPRALVRRLSSLPSSGQPAAPSAVQSPLPSASPCASTPPPRVALTDLSLARLRDLFSSLELPAYRATQIWQGLYGWKPAGSAGDARPVLLRPPVGRASPATSSPAASPPPLAWDNLSTLSKADRVRIAGMFAETQPVSVASESRSRDGTVKWLLNVHDAGEKKGSAGEGAPPRVVEAVYIPEFPRLPAPRSGDKKGSNSAGHGGRWGRSPAAAASSWVQLDDGDDQGGLSSDDEDDELTPAVPAARPGAKRGSSAPPAVAPSPTSKAGRGTLCVSSQAGCSLACTFCHTGTQKLLGNLTPGQIVGQYLAARQAVAGSTIELQGRLTPLPAIRSLVFMGQGEPLMNWRHVSTAISILTDPTGLAIPPRRITVSTSGVAPRIAALATETPGVRLAVSLHAPNDALRSRIMGINDQWPIAAVLGACNDFLEHRRAATASASSHAATRVTFEYTLLAGVNDSLEHARELAELLLVSQHALPLGAAHINLIPFNAWEGAPYAASPHPAILAFQAELGRHAAALTARSKRSGGSVGATRHSPAWEGGEALRVHIRRTRGQDVMGACGQLRAAFVPPKATRPRGPA